MTPDEDKRLIDLLRARDARHTRLELEGGRAIDVWNIAWGYDDGADFAHVTTNISPARPDCRPDVFYTNQVVRVVDVESGKEVARFD